MYQSTGQYSATEIQALPFVDQQIPVQQPWGYSGNVDYYRYNKNTDWQDEIFRPAYKQHYSLNVSGGDEVAVYGLSLGFVNKESVVEGSDFNRFNARINTGIKFNPAIQVFTNMSFVYGMKNLANEGNAGYLNPIYSALVKAPLRQVLCMISTIAVRPNTKKWISSATLILPLLQVSPIPKILSTVFWATST